MCLIIGTSKRNTNMSNYIFEVKKSDGDIRTRELSLTFDGIKRTIFVDPEHKWLAISSVGDIYSFSKKPSPYRNRSWDSHPLCDSCHFVGYVSNTDPKEFTNIPIQLIRLDDNTNYHFDLNPMKPTKIWEPSNRSVEVSIDSSPEIYIIPKTHNFIRMTEDGSMQTSASKDFQIVTDICSFIGGHKFKPKTFELVGVDVCLPIKFEVVRGT